MSFFFHPEAKEELNDVVDFYEQSQPGLGLEFAEERRGNNPPLPLAPTWRTEGHLL
jgi:hypothetical protein